jgi:hypothetical protein
MTSLFGNTSQILANASGTVLQQRLASTAGQTIFNLTAFNYVPGTSSLIVFINGQKQCIGVDFLETSASSFTFTSPLTAVDVVDVVGFPDLTLTANIDSGLRATLASSTGADGIGFGATTVSLAITALQARATALETSAAYSAYADAENIGQVFINLTNAIAQSIDCHGDSTFYGSGTGGVGQVANPPPQILQATMNNFLGANNLTVNNNALGGTSLNQMILGTDGSGSTYAAKMLISTAKAVYCNHCVNDAQGSNSTALSSYRNNLLSFIYLTRAAGKVPILVTPHPILAIGSFGSDTWVQATAMFCMAMKDIAYKHQVTLVDNNAMFHKMLGGGNYRALDMFPDGAHASNAIYLKAGINLCEPLLGSLIPTLTADGQVANASESFIRGTSITNNSTVTARSGASKNSSVATNGNMKVLFRVAEVGFDFSILQIAFNLGAAGLGMNLDGTGVGTAINSQALTGFSAAWPQENEIVVQRNIDPGIHQLTITNTSSGAIALSGIKLRKRSRQALLANAAAVPINRIQVASKLSLSAATTDQLFLVDTVAASRFDYPLQVEWTSQMPKISGVVLCGGLIGTNAALTGPEKFIYVALNASGFVTVYEATAPGTYTTTVLGAVDLSVASHVYRVVLSAANPGTCTVYVDDAAIGSPVALTQPHLGGLLGVWKNTTATILNVYDLSIGYAN